MAKIRQPRAKNVSRDSPIRHLARKLSPKITSADEDLIADQLWDQPGEWVHLAKSVDEQERVASELAREIARMKEPERHQIRQALEELGFSILGTGGGCEAYYLGLTDAGSEGPHFLITDPDCVLPVVWNEQAYIGYYPEFGDIESDETYDTVRELVDLLRAGKGHPRWKGPAPALSSEDIDVINEHRRSIGMAPIDISAGWSAKEIAEMAKSIRKTGRMANTATLERLTKVRPAW